LDRGRYERGLRDQGFSLIAGVDEVGRGAWAGPMMAAAVILPEGFDITGLRDSKVLSAKQREDAYERIVEGARAVSICAATAFRIDRRGLHKCNIALLKQAVRQLPVEPDYVLFDGWPLSGVDVPHLSIKKGDSVCATIAAASIVAKVSRDRVMKRFHQRFPEFGFDRNKGYGTSEHREVLDLLGPTPIHRLSFHGVGPDPMPELQPESVPSAAGIMGA
jgi:ribonuclease HII